MQYTESIVDCLKGIAKAHPEPIDWQSACEQVKDPRRKQGQRFSLTSILLLALAAMLSNHLSELAIAQWGAGQSEEIKKALGFENGVTPHQTTSKQTDVETKEKQKSQSKLTEEKEQEEQEAKKQKSELAVASRLIQHIDWQGKVLTGDALYCQRCLCSALRQAGGDYLFLVKGNQPQLLEDLRVLAGSTRPGKTSRRGGLAIT